MTTLSPAAMDRLTKICFHATTHALAGFIGAAPKPVAWTGSGPAAEDARSCARFVAAALPTEELAQLEGEA